MYYPLKFEPEYKKYIWGGRNLERLGKILPKGKIAESWEVSCQEDGMSTISNGIYKGQTLCGLIKETGSLIIGSALVHNEKAEFPLLFKLIDANQQLSVQVHPNDKYAYIFESKSSGKHEAWYIVSAKPGARIVYSVIPGVSRAVFFKAIKQAKVSNCLHYLNVIAGDVIDICPGVLHSVGAGIVLAEIQQNSNITYRVFDFDRTDGSGAKRALHLKKAMDVLTFDTSKNKAKYRGLSVKLEGDSVLTYTLANKYFSVELLKIDGEIEQEANGCRFYIYYMIEGKAVLQHQNGFTSLEKGESVLVPASMGKFTLSGQCKVLKTYVPDIKENIIAQLLEAHYSRSEISENVLGEKE